MNQPEQVAERLEAQFLNAELMEEAASLIRSLVREKEELHELVWDVSGRSTEFAIVKQVERLRDAMKEGKAHESFVNLADALATATAYSIAAHRWAVLEHERADTAEEKLATLSDQEPKHV